MDATDLKFFQAVSKAGSMSGASESLHTVQSNVTSRIKKLEQELDTALFVRTAKGVYLTPAGERLLPHARRVALALENAAAAVHDVDTVSGKLVIGALETTAAMRLSPYLTRFTQQYPSVDLSIITGTSQEMLERVLAHDIDGAFIGGSIYRQDIETTQMFKEELVVVSGPGHHTLASCLQPNDLKILVLRPNCVYRTILETMLIKRGLFEFKVLEFGTLESIIGGVSANIGITLLPRFLIEKTYANFPLKTHRIEDSLANIDTSFIVRRDAYMTLALKKFIDIVRPTDNLCHLPGHSKIR
ncbi:LysR family transcriptional regulator [Halomonas sp. V046]|uniref:LysR family transcriptional regulator n=1 Tax=Halomonas sp. V046 TaxID=3459611 RepID=UPI004043CBB9